MSEIERIEAELPAAIDTSFEAMSLDERQKYALALTREAIMTIAELAEENKTDLDGLARAEVLLDAMRADLLTVLDDIRVYMNHAAQSKQFSINGVGVYEKTLKGATVEWDDSAVWSQLRNFAATQDVDLDAFETMREIVSTFAGISYWRVTPLKDIGIDPDEEGLRDRQRGIPTVRRLTKGAKL